MEISDSNNQLQQDDVDLTEICKNQCLQYLLGELPHNQLASFEERLGRSDRLAQELQQQSEMIVNLSEVLPLPDATSRPTVSTNSQTVNLYSQKFGLERPLMKGLVIAVAVCIAGFTFRTWWSSTRSPLNSELPRDDFAAIVVDNGTNMTQASESILIARAWAATQVDSQDSRTMPNAAVAGTEVQTINSSDNELELGTEEINDSSDDSFSWMFTAAFELHELESNDG